MLFTQRTFKDALGATVIQSQLQPAPDRQGFESRDAIRYATPFNSKF